MEQRSECKQLLVLVTADELELPMAVEESRRKMAETLGEDISNIFHKIKRSAKIPIGAPRQSRAEKRASGSWSWMMMTRNKYGNRKINADGQTFDSEHEFRRWRELRLLERAGEISGLRRQVKFELIPPQRKKDGKAERAVCYLADFVYQDRDGSTVVEDAKGVRTKEYIIKRKLMLHVHGLEIREV